jgi:hypothetical protein
VNKGEFIVEAAGPKGLVAVFEDDGETGYLYLYEPEVRGIVRHLHIYNRTAAVQPTERDVECRWAADENRCGVFVWRVLRGAIDIKHGTEHRAPIHDELTPGINDSAWLMGF